MALNPGGTGTTAYCDHGSGVDTSGSFTWIALVDYSTGWSGRVYLVSKDWDGTHQASWYIRDNAANRMKLDLEYPTTWLQLIAASGSALTAGWWWLAVVHDGAAQRGHLYQAAVGSPFAEVTYSTQTDGVGTYTSSTNNLVVGGSVGPSFSYHEAMELSAGFSSVLSLNDLIAFQGHQHDVSGGNIEWLTWYGRDRASATAEQEDLSGNGNHGTPTNSGWAFADGPSGRRFPRRSQTYTPALTAAGILGLADFSLPSLSITGLGDIPIAGAASFNLPVPTIAGIGNLPIDGLADFALPVPGITGVGTAGAAPILGDADFTLPVPSILGIGDIPVAGLADFNLPAMNIPAVGDILVKGVADFNLPALALSATGVVGTLSTVDGAADFNLPNLWVNTQGGVDIPMVNIYSITGQTGADTGTAFTLQRRAGVWFINRDVLAQVILGAGTATINIEASLDGGSTFANITTALTASGVVTFNLPPIIRVRLSAATGATVSVWLDADLVLTRVDS